ncbi:hypothetical protein L207DRAFT_502936 [Hyaloscypha variabilis F]|uniref:Uncharacterized protein n=1 Tax=Hyaloscypha variabilis (strain UAMH 11265 / GT02V1 / F) TaxID=1149755 RepID=A0A2J6QV80_HYAVF|nr:hypothetical protein L207DRAFT_502936 [Hyaloscypha variabilis F]
MGRLVKLLGSGIGLASEAIHNRKSSSSNVNRADDAGEGSSRSAAPPVDYLPPQYVEVPDHTADELIAAGKAVPADAKDPHLYDRDEKSPHNDEEDDSLSEEGDEEQWELDEAVSYPEPSEGAPEDIGVLTDTFMRNHPPPAYTPSETGQAHGKLPCPVIIPQRRPRDKKRGFVRAYAPVLADCGIDQATFLDFLKTFHASTREDKSLQVVNIAAMSVGMVPNPIAMGVSIAVQVCVGVAMEVQRRHRTNTFLDRMNNEFFKPRGLYCLIMTYKPDSTQLHARIDINETISSSMTPAASSTKQTFKNLRLSSGKTYGELELPEAAPLIFPALDSLPDSEKEKQSKMKSSKKFLADYFDRRAQAKFAGEMATQGGSKLSVGAEPQFKSRYADPNSAANSGSLIALLTGGHVNPKDRRDRKRGSRRIHRAVRRGEEVGPNTQKRRGGKEGVVKRMLKKDVLYLMIVNLPSEEELKIGKDAVDSEGVEGEL